MSNLTTVQVQSESKIKKIGQNWVYGEDLRSLTPKTKKWGNNHLSRRFGKYSFDTYLDSPKLAKKGNFRKFLDPIRDHRREVCTEFFIKRK